MIQNLNTKEAGRVLSAWTALEVLSPQTFRKPEDVVAGDPNLIARLDRESLPWENGGETTAKNKKLFYQIVVGTVSMQKAKEALEKKYPQSKIDHSADPKPSESQAIIATFLVTREGRLVPDSIALSSFAWGVPQALAMHLKTLGFWTTIERILLKIFNKALCLRMTDEDDKQIPLDKDIIEEVFFYLLKTFRLPIDMVEKPYFAIKTLESTHKKDPPQPFALLNSFYLQDLIQARNLVQRGQASHNLKQYLGMQNPTQRDDLLSGHMRLEEAVAPRLIPSARWPSMKRHPLVLLQQAAVNLALNKLSDGGILAINGPPGTGKTTLLRDVVASLIAKRAEAMCTFDDPSLAFKPTGEKIKTGQGWMQLHRLDNKLKGFEILFASSNNKAVENISTELPNLKAIAEDADDLRYFNVLSDSLFGYKSWGLIAAVLGNSSNRWKFVNTFWNDSDVGFATYLAEAAGMPQNIDICDPKTGQIIKTRPPRIVQEHTPPHSHQDALNRWHQARADFQAALAKSQEKLAKLEVMRTVFQCLDTLSPDEIDFQKIETLWADHQKKKPWFIFRFFRTAKARAWAHRAQILTDIRSKIVAAEAYQYKLGHQVIDKRLFSKNRKDTHLTSPWCDQETHLLRDAVFVAAIKLHKAFIDAAAKPLHQNLGIFMQYLTTPASIGEHTRLMPDLWSSFFQVVPCVSTTFASVNRMLQFIPQDSFGWLLVDEAGQATPQATVGAIIRSKRAIVVGDPMQIQPIVLLPSDLTRRICHEFEIDPDRFNAPEASVQTLADKATAYFTEFHGRHGNRTVGIPLLVHRRCNDPMFSIANVIAYDQLMVQAKQPGHSMIRDCLGASAWFHVTGSGEDKWCAEEGQKLLELLFALKVETGPPDIYIVTPFVIVADRIRKIILSSGILKTWKVANEYAWIYERIGTVHTVQGREAEAIFFVLGAPSEGQRGARIWAGSLPNLLNVAITRAKEVVYIIGNRSLWCGSGFFSELAKRVPVHAKEFDSTSHHSSA
ncbi:MAG: AAA domain-containing protein [Pseudomonadota bacterium]